MILRYGRCKIGLMLMTLSRVSIATIWRLARDAFHYIRDELTSIAKTISSYLRAIHSVFRYIWLWSLYISIHHYMRINTNGERRETFAVGCDIVEVNVDYRQISIE